MCIQDLKSSQTTKVKIPHELVLKFVCLEGLILTTQYTFERDTSKGLSDGAIILKEKNPPCVILDLSGDPICFNACIEWYKAQPCKIDIGQYRGLFPVALDCNGRVEFSFDDVVYGKENWKDWFTKENKEYASK